LSRSLSGSFPFPSRRQVRAGSQSAVKFAVHHEPSARTRHHLRKAWSSTLCRDTHEFVKNSYQAPARWVSVPRPPPYRSGPRSNHDSSLVDSFCSRAPGGASCVDRGRLPDSQCCSLHSS
jgi:hypothetical protein